MAVDIFLKLDGIKGESQDVGHKDEIDVVSYHWGIVNARGPARTGDHGREAGRPRVAVALRRLLLG